MNHSLIKLVDASLFPAAALVVSKVIGLVVVITIFQLPWDLLSAGGLLGVGITPVMRPEHVALASTYSDLVMLVLMGLGFSFVLARATIFSHHRISPRMLVKLSNANLMGLVKSSYDVYHHASIWLMFMWIAVITIWLNVALLKTELWVGLAAFITVIAITSILLQDVSREINLSRKSLGKFKAF